MPSSASGRLRPGSAGERLALVGLVVGGVASVLVLVGLLEITVRWAGLAPPPIEHPYFVGMRTDPVLGRLPKANWSGHWIPSEASETFVVSTDERGFRTTGFEPPASPRARVAFLGDSCTFGWAMDTPDAYVAQLDALQRRSGPPELELLNAAHPGYSAVVGEIHLRERVLPLAPDVVVIAFSAHNAFRYSRVSDVDRYAYFRLRRLAFRLHLVQLVTARLQALREPPPPPRNRESLMEAGRGEWRRVADAAEFEASMRRMAEDAREGGAKPLFLLFPRSVQISEDPRFRLEDAAYSARRRMPERSPDGEISGGEMALLESSCLDVRSDDALDRLHDEIRSWQPLRPARHIRGLLHSGARARARGDAAAALASFRQAVDVEPDAPMALYDLGVAEIEAGDAERGLARLEKASVLACNVFLQYQVIVWRLAVELDVPVVDIVMLFQAYPDQDLMMDGAHFTTAGNRLVADALWSALSGDVDELRTPRR